MRFSSGAGRTSSAGPTEEERRAAEDAEGAEGAEDFRGWTERLALPVAQHRYPHLPSERDPTPGQIKAEGLLVK